MIVIQQIDGNIICPKIVGSTTGLSSFWVLFGILLFGGLYGFVGMIIGVPVFAVIYDIIEKTVRYCLDLRGENEVMEAYDQRFPKPIEDSEKSKTPNALTVAMSKLSAKINKANGKKGKK